VTGDDSTGPNVWVIQRTPSLPALAVETAVSLDTPVSCWFPWNVGQFANWGAAARVTCSVVPPAGRIGAADAGAALSAEAMIANPETAAAHAGTAAAHPRTGAAHAASAALILDCDRTGIPRMAGTGASSRIFAPPSLRRYPSSGRLKGPFS
jgi:hypothetical protein